MNLEERTFLITHFSWWLGIAEEKIDPLLDSCIPHSLTLEQVKIQTPPLSDQLIRMWAFTFLKNLPLPACQKAKTLIKSIRRRIRRPGVILPNQAPIQESPWCQAVENFKTKITENNLAKSRSAGPLGPAICLMHDVDTVDCYKAIPEITRLEQESGIPSAYFFLTGGEYPFDPALARNLDSDGFEVGLHGLTHDLAIGYRTNQSIEDHIRQALDRLEIPVVGYRAPAFAISEPLLRVLEKIDFLYDSSLHMWHPMYPSTGLAFPYHYPSSTLMEVPLSIEDSMLLDDFQLTSKQALTFIEKTLETIAGFGGVCTLNIHPRRIIQHPTFFAEVLKTVKCLFPSSAFRTPRELIATYHQPND